MVVPREAILLFSCDLSAEDIDGVLWLDHDI